MNARPVMLLVAGLVIVAGGAFALSRGAPPSSPGASGPSPLAATASTGAASSGATSAPSVTAGATPRASAAPAATKAAASVDLVFSGTLNFAAKGSAGACKLFTRSDGTISFGFEATEADYRGLGQSFSPANLDGTFVDIKWAVDTKLSWGNSTAAPVVLSADHRSVQLNGTLSPFGPAGGPLSGPESVTGTVSCP